MEIKAYAKINLSLNIVSLGKMHALDSVMARVDLFDSVTINPSQEFCVRYDLGIEGGGTVEKAYGIIERDCSDLAHPISVDVKKGIPIGAGLGGSSADSAAVMRYFGVTNSEIALKAGSDVPFMSGSGAARVQGLGEKITPVFCPEMYFVLLTGGCVLSRDSFVKFDEIYGAPHSPTDNGRLIDAMKASDFSEIGRLIGNALSQPSMRLNPKISDAYERFHDHNPLGIVMTGSGSGVIALFDSHRRASEVATAVGGRVIKTLKSE
ncbi:MAG: hypothetical protein IJD07_04845 [Clostridia bacterium]|nr:hypothetical protein [Clostridia bacterium]